jgi:hypothetical protein
MSLSIFLCIETSFPIWTFQQPITPHRLKNKTFFSSQHNTPMLPYHSSPSLIGFHFPLVVIFIVSWNLSHPYAIFPIVSSSSSIFLIVVPIACHCFRHLIIICYHHSNYRIIVPTISYCSHHPITLPSSCCFNHPIVSLINPCCHPYPYSLFSLSCLQSYHFGVFPSSLKPIWNVP